MKKVRTTLLNFFAIIVLVLSNQPPTTWAAHNTQQIDEPPDPRHSGLDLPERAPGALVPDSSADVLSTNALVDWSKVLFQSYRDGNWEIYRADGAGSNQERLTNNGATDIQPRLNRGNTKIVFASNRTGNYEIFSMNSNGSGVTQLTFDGANDTNPVWSPDGSRIAFQSFRDGNWEVYVMNANGSGLGRLTHDADYDAEPAWSPDGNSLAFISRRTGGYRVYVMDTNGAGQTQLSNQAYSTEPNWSPDGSQIAYSADADGDGWYDLWTMNANGTGQTLLVAGSSSNNSDVIARSWSPDGNFLAFTHVYWVEIGGQYYWASAYLEYRNQGNGSIAQLSNHGDDWEPDWQTIDVLRPATRATTPSVWTQGGTFTVNWSGADAGGAGLKSYDVQYRDGLGGAWVDWQINTTNTSANYNGVTGHSYFFRTRSRDNAYNQEPYPSVPDASTSTYDYALAGTVFGNREQPVAVAGLTPAPGALNSGLSDAAGLYKLYFTQTGPYSVTATRSGFGNLPALRNVANNSTGVDLFLPPADDRIVNGGLETGTLGPWVSTGELAAIVVNNAHTGLRGVQLGNGLSAYAPDESYVPLDPTNTSTPVFVLKWGSFGSGPGQSYIPDGIAVSPNGTAVYVTDPDNDRIEKFDAFGNFLLEWGTTGTGPGQFDLPYTVAVDGAGDVYVSDHLNNRIQKFDANGNYLTQWGTTGNGNGQFINPYGIAIDSSGNIYITDTNNHRVQKFSSNGVFITKWGSLGSGDSNLHTPNGIGVDRNGFVYVADLDNYRVMKYDSSGNFITKWGSFGSSVGLFNQPTGLAVDTGNNVYVADALNHRIQKFTSAGVFMVQWGGYGTGDGQYHRPRGVHVDPFGFVWVADSDNARWQKFSQAWLTPTATFSGTAVITPIGGLVTAGAVTVTVPTGAVVTTTTFMLARSDFTPSPPAGLTVAGFPFSVTAVITGGIPLTETQAAVTVTVKYSDGNLQSGNIASEATLQLWQYDEYAAVWQPLTGTLDTINNRVVATTTRLGLLAVLGTAHVGPWVTMVEQPITLGAALAPSSTLSLMYNVAAVNALSDSVRIQLIGASQTYTFTLSGAALAAGIGSWHHAWFAVPSWANGTLTVRIELFEANRSTPTVLTFDEISLGATASGGYATRLPIALNASP